MKIVDRKTFLALPGETLYSEYDPCNFGPLQIKSDTVGANDFLTQQIADAVQCNNSAEFSSILFEAQRTGASFSMDFDYLGRDGIFDDDQLFAIWEPADVAALIARLDRIANSGAFLKDRALNEHETWEISTKQCPSCQQAMRQIFLGAKEAACPACGCFWRPAITAPATPEK